MVQSPCPDWWYDPQSALEQTHKSLEELLQRDRAAAMANASATAYYFCS